MMSLPRAFSEGRQIREVGAMPLAGMDDAQARPAIEIERIRLCLDDRHDVRFRPI